MIISVSEAGMHSHVQRGNEGETTTAVKKNSRSHAPAWECIPTLFVKPTLIGMDNIIVD